MMVWGLVGWLGALGARRGCGAAIASKGGRSNAARSSGLSRLGAACDVRSQGLALSLGPEGFHPEIVHGDFVSAGWTGAAGIPNLPSHCDCGIWIGTGICPTATAL